VQKASGGLNISPLTREMVKTGSLNPMLNQVSGLVLSIAASADHNGLDDTLKVIEVWTNMKLNQKRITFQDEKKHRQKKYLIQCN
jgi:ribosomal protein L22